MERANYKGRSNLRVRLLREEKLCSGGRDRTSAASPCMEEVIAWFDSRSWNSSEVIWSAARMAARLTSITAPEARICRIDRSRCSATARVCSGAASLRMAYD